MTVDHKPWKGPLYDSAGINGQRIAIVGHSHHGGQDNNGYTNAAVRDVISGRERYRFFTSIRNCFGYNDDGDFWNRVLFFNFLPSSVGPDEDRYNRGTAKQVELARERFLRILSDQTPQKVIVFSKKAWSTLPETIEEALPIGKLNLLEIEGKGCEWGTYPINGHVIVAFGLRHPQGADSALLRKTVRQIIAVPVDRLAN